MESGKIKKLQDRNRFLEKFYAENKRKRLESKERVKELTCMYNIAKCVVVEEDIDIIITNIIELMPGGWQFPQDVNVRIRISGMEFKNDGFKITDIVLKENIFFNDNIIGEMEVFYSERAEIDLDYPFLDEEKDLLSGISNIISLSLKQHEDSKQKKIIQGQLLHADRLATIGELAAGVAHELNEPLTNILGFAQLSLKDEEISQSIVRDLKKIEDASFHAKAIIQKLMEFSRQGASNSEVFDLSSIVDDNIYFIESRCAKDGITIIRKFAKDVTIFADKGQIKQIVTNLTINGMQAMSRGGQLIVETRRDDKNAFLIVHDNGEGISSENIDKIFLPFFTTKDVGEGTGLGLSVVYGIVKAHGGDITVGSKEGEGTTFQISFPLGVISS